MLALRFHVRGTEAAPPISCHFQVVQSNMGEKIQKFPRVSGCVMKLAEPELMGLPGSRGQEHLAVVTGEGHPCGFSFEDPQHKGQLYEVRSRCPIFWSPLEESRCIARGEMR